MTARIHQILQQVRAGLGEGCAPHMAEEVSEIGEQIISRIEELLAVPPAVEPAVAALADSAIYVVLTSDDLNGKYRERALAGDPQRRPNPIVFETNVIGATLENANRKAAHFEAQLYGPCRVGRVVFTDEQGRPL